ncbi:hypothetical protein HKCCE3408_05840 [Rhodobacterales bacterium HKCCE3408]|nr:hypothetical protein [Rhodobacterales bacterium HKCCE3408]
MSSIAEQAQGFRTVLAVNIDRLLVALTIMGALTLAGWLLGYATVN